MTAVGKILVFLNLVFSLVVGAFVIMIYLARTHWVEEYNKLGAQNKVLAASEQTYKSEADKAQQDAAAKIKKVQADITNVQKDLQAALAENKQLSKDLEEEKKKSTQQNALASSAVVETQKRQADVALLRESLKKETDLNTTLVKKNNELQDQATAAVIERKSVQDQNSRLEAQLQQMARDMARMQVQRRRHGDGPRRRQEPAARERRRTGQGHRSQRPDDHHHRQRRWADQGSYAGVVPSQSGVADAVEIPGHGAHSGGDGDASGGAAGRSSGRSAADGRPGRQPYFGQLIPPLAVPHSRETENHAGCSIARGSRCSEDGGGALGRLRWPARRFAAGPDRGHAVRVPQLELVSGREAETDPDCSARRGPSTHRGPGDESATRSRSTAARRSRARRTTATEEAIRVDKTRPSLKRKRRALFAYASGSDQNALSAAHIQR